MTRIVFHIDKLVLRGLQRADAKALSAGLSQALIQSMSEPASVAALLAQGDRVRVNVGRIRTGAHPEATGQAIGACIAGVKMR